MLLETHWAAITKAENDFNDYCSSKEIYELYINECLKQQVWLGYRSMTFYAYHHSIAVYLWHKNTSQRMELVLTDPDLMIANQPSHTIHMLYTAGATHYNLLVPPNTLVAEHTLRVDPALAHSEPEKKRDNHPQWFSENRKHSTTAMREWITAETADVNATARKSQIKAIDEYISARESTGGTQRVHSVFHFPTGFGKSYVAIIALAKMKEKSYIFVPTILLIDQFLKDFKTLCSYDQSQSATHCNRPHC